ncbi:FAD-dependent monooxygenase [Nonomuraea sp. 3N208]|uniref:FAD-dependent monooxygenase n=1 Tax=Nonomuraea sp. 3N208 TaxID=3457421 RepID=UPI003FD4950A
MDDHRVTLLGDAAHAMSPAGGAGANLALSDAAALTAALTRGGLLIPALRSHEHQMIDAGFAAVRASAANGAHILGQDPLPAG